MLEGSTSSSNVGLFYRENGTDKWELYHRGADNQFTLYSYAASDRVVVVDPDGRMGVLNKDPNANLHIGSGTDTNVTVGSQSNPALQIGGTTNYRLGLYTDSEAGYIENKNSDNGIVLKVKTTGIVATVKSSGVELPEGQQQFMKKAHVLIKVAYQALVLLQMLLIQILIILL